MKRPPRPPAPIRPGDDVPGACRLVSCANLVTANGALQVPRLVSRLTARQLGLRPGHPYLAYARKE